MKANEAEYREAAFYLQLSARRAARNRDMARAGKYKRRADEYHQLADGLAVTTSGDARFPNTH